MYNYNYACMLYYGKIVRQDKKEAVKYFKMAADKGYTDAILKYGRILYQGDGIDKNLEEAARYFKIAIDSGNTDAIHIYNQCLKMKKNLKNK